MGKPKPESAAKSRDPSRLFYASAGEWPMARLLLWEVNRKRGTSP
jgi:hypothetical protein